MEMVPGAATPGDTRMAVVLMLMGTKANEEKTFFAVVRVSECFRERNHILQ